MNYIIFDLEATCWDNDKSKPRLTTIKQEDVNEAKVFNNIIKEFEDWIVSDDLDMVLCSWGFYDKKQIRTECEVKDYSGNICALLKKHISIKHQFAKIKNIQPCGMWQALDMMGFKLDGTHHRGIDDARNITKIFKAIFYDLKF